MTKKASSKSQAKRVEAQTKAVEEPKGKSPAVVTVDSKDVQNEILERLAKLEANQRNIYKCFEFAANEVRPLYSFGPIAAIFDEIAKRLSK
jgi:hypothetical protein